MPTPHPMFRWDHRHKEGEGEDYCCINWNAVRGPIGEWNDSLLGGTHGYDSGANDGPYASLFEFNQKP